MSELRNSIKYWMELADQQQNTYGIGQHRTTETILNDGLRYEIRALTMQVRELTEIIKQSQALR